MYSISKTFEFEASHKLILNYKSPCTKIHGHSYKVLIEVFTNKLDKNGMVIDFTELKYIKDWVMNNWDHTIIISENDPEFNDIKNLNCVKIFPFTEGNVTAELMAKKLFDITLDSIGRKLDSRCKKINIEIWETSSNRAKYSYIPI